MKQLAARQHGVGSLVRAASDHLQGTGRMVRSTVIR
jgi:hypothetical protein